MKKRIGKFFIILGVIFFCLTPFYNVKAEDTYHYNVFDVFFQGAMVGSGEFTCYNDYMVANERYYVREITVNFAAYYRGNLRISLFTYPGDYIIVEGASISSANSSATNLWLAGSNYVHMKVYSTHNFDSGWQVNDVIANEPWIQVEMSPGESRQEIIDLLDTSNDNWTSMLSMITDIRNMFGTGSNIQNVDVDSIRGMLHTIRSEILAIGVLDGVIASKVGQISDVVDNLEDVNTQLTSIVTLLADIDDNLEFDTLSDKLDELIAAIDQLSGSFNVTNNITLQNHNIPQYQYNAINAFLDEQFSYLKFDELDLPYFRPSELPSSVSSGFVSVTSYTDYYICFITDNTGVNINIDDVSYNKNICPSPDGRFYRYVKATFESYTTHTITFRGTKNVRFYPIYVGPLDLMPNEVRMMFGLPLSGEYSSLLNSIYNQILSLHNFDDSDILDAIDDLADLLRNLSIDNTVSHETIITTINNFNVDIDTVHNVEVNIKNSFNTYRQRFNTNILDDRTWFSPVLFNYLFNGIWSNNNIPWILSLILFCALILAMLGLRR